MIRAPAGRVRRSGVARSAGALKVLGQATRFGSLVLVIATARVLGPAEFGKFTFAYALATVLGIVLDFGISVVLTRAVARDPGATAERWATASTLKLLLLGLIGPVYLAVPLLMHRPWDTTAAVWLLGLAIALQAFLENAVSVFTAVQRLEQELQMRLLEKSVLVTVGLRRPRARRRAPRGRGGVRPGRGRVARSSRSGASTAGVAPLDRWWRPGGSAAPGPGAGPGRPGAVPRRRHLPPGARRPGAPHGRPGRGALRGGVPRLRRRVGRARERSRRPSSRSSPGRRPRSRASGRSRPRRSRRSCSSRCPIALGLGVGASWLTPRIYGAALRSDRRRSWPCWAPPSRARCWGTFSASCSWRSIGPAGCGRSRRWRS